MDDETQGREGSIVLSPARNPYDQDAADTEEDKRSEKDSFTQESLQERQIENHHAISPPSLHEHTHPSLPPNGGLRAWMQVLGGALVFFNIWGLPLSFGVFQAYYSTAYLSSQSDAAISAIGTTQSFLLIVIGVFTGPLFDLGHYKTTLLLGSFLNVFGLMMLSLSTRYYQVMLSQGICVGLGSGMLYIPTLALVAGSFTTKRPIAMGILTSGIGPGGVVYVVAFQRLIHTLGFGWTVRVLGFISLATNLVAIPALLLGPTKLAGKPRALFDRSALTDVPFLTFAISGFFIFLGYFVPLFYIPSYAEMFAKTSLSFSFYLVAISSAASFFGRLGAAVAATYYGVMAPWITCGTVSGLLCFCWLAIRDSSSMVALSILYGFFSGGLIALPPSIFPRVCPDLSMLGTRMGMSWTVTAIAGAIGGPVAGVLAEAKANDYVGLQVWGGAVLLFGTAQLALLWYLLAKKSTTGIFL